MPDLIGAARTFGDNRRQFVVRISEDENTQRFRRIVGVLEQWSNDSNLLHYSRCASAPVA